MANLFQLFANMLQRVVIKTVSSENYTILDADGYTEIQVTTGASDRTISLPTLADNLNRKITIRKMDSGVGKVIVAPEATEYINDWQANVEITEQYGWWEFTAISGKWITKTDGLSTIYMAITDTADTGLALDGSYDDVEGMTLNMTGKRGTYLLSSFLVHRVGDTSLPSYLTAYTGLGITPGNVQFDIVSGGGHNITVPTGYINDFRFNKQIIDYEYDINSDISIYLKVLATSDEMNVTTHAAYGSGANGNMYIKARRIR